MTRIAIIGAGWAGLAAGVELADRGHHVEIFEASRTLGGRARSLEWNGLTIDNGQHILIGAYSECLRLMRMVSVDPDKALMRIPLTLFYPGEFRMVAPHLPAPFHTVFALALTQGMSWSEKWAAIRLMAGLQRSHYRIEPDITVSEWLDRNQTPSRQRRLLWEPLCISALNTPAERASAQIMANVLRDSLGGPREASDMLIPRVTLSDLFPEPAARFIEARGGVIRRSQRVRSLRREEHNWRVDESERFDQVVIATAPYHLAALLPEQDTQLAAMAYEPIVTTYLRYGHSVNLDSPMIGIADKTVQWAFDLEKICGREKAGFVSAVISARGRHSSLDVAALEATVIDELKPYLPSQLQEAPQTLTIVEQRATFSCRPAAWRIPNYSAKYGCYVSGDATEGDYPGTLEQAVRSGVASARLVAQAMP